jgi:glycine cleavage system regulatory protein
MPADRGQKGGDVQNLLVMTVIGKDRTGLVESISRIIEDHGGNWLESRMCRLGGEFAGILRVRVPEEREAGLIRSLQELDSRGLTVITRQDEAGPPAGQKKTAMLSLIGSDRPGIIRQVSAVLAHQSINVEELETECSSAPMSGEMIFQALAKLQIPNSCVISELRRELEALGSEMMVEISFTET